MTGALFADLPDREQAREAARQELQRRQYRDEQPSLTQRAIEWVVEQLQEVLDAASASVPGGGWGLLALVLLIIGLAVLVLTRLRPTRSGTGKSALFSGLPERSADEHRRLADSLSSSGDHAGAVRERLRAIVRELESRGVLDPRPGRTADEVALEGGRAVPAVADSLREAVRLFDEVWYGGRTADSATYARLVALDTEVGRARLVTA